MSSPEAKEFIAIVYLDDGSFREVGLDLGQRRMLGRYLEAMFAEIGSIPVCSEKLNLHRNPVTGTINVEEEGQQETSGTQQVDR